MINKSGERPHPCFTPLLMEISKFPTGEKVSAILSWQLVFHEDFVQNVMFHCVVSFKKYTDKGQ